MILDRKAFLRRTGLGALGMALAGTRSAATEPPRFDSADPDGSWARVRAQYEIHPGLCYLNAGGLGPSPRGVLESRAAAARMLQERVETGHALLDDARRTLADFLGADGDEVCFTRNATEGNSIVAAGLDLRAGDEVIFESHAHPGGSLPWLNQAQRRGVVVKVFDPDAASASANLERIAGLATDRTRVIQVSHVTAPTGIVMPVAAIAAFARSRGIWFHVDGAQSLGLLPVDVREIGCDSLAGSGHKWLGGPRETGVLFIRREGNDRVAPVHVGAYSSCDFDFSGRLDYATGARRHEYGTRDAAAVVALAAAARFQYALGRERIAAYGTELAGRLRAGLGEIRGVDVLTPAAPGLAAAMTTFQIRGIDASRIFGYLLETHGLRCRPVTEAGLQAVRISTHVFNTAAECDRLIAAVAAFVRAAS